MRPRFVVLASLLAAGLAVTAPAVASAAPRHNHGLTINATPNPILAGEGVLIYGQLRGTDIGHKPVLLYHRVAGAPRFTLVGVTRTDSHGFYEFTRAEGVVLTRRSWFVRGPGHTHSRTRSRAGPGTGDARCQRHLHRHQPPDHVHRHGHARTTRSSGSSCRSQNASGSRWHTVKAGRLDACVELLDHPALAYPGTARRARRVPGRLP